ncbi:MAG: hypothetical protein Q9157_000248 [Trypethelium eluteriae]
MEAIAAVSSFAGIIGLAGQCVGGLETLKNLFESIAAASKTVDGFLRDINGLLRTLHDVELLLDTISKKASADEADADVASLQIQLEDCSREISSWLKTARDLRPSPGRGTKSWARKFWVAVNQESVRGIRQEISCRRTEINTSLLLLSTCVWSFAIGLTRGISTARKADVLETKVEQSKVASSEQHSDSNAHIGEILQRLETLNSTTMSILSHSEGSMRSLQSVSSSISRMSGISEDPPPPYRTISRRSSSDFLRESSRSSTAQSARRAQSSGSQTSLSIFGLSSVVENVRLEHDKSEKLSKTILRSSRFPNRHPEVSHYVSRMRLVGLLKQEIDFIDHILMTTLANDGTMIDSPIHAEMVHQREELKVIRDDVMYSAEYHRKSITALGDTETKICNAWSGFLQDRQSDDENSQPGLATDGIIVQSYDASLLGNWNGTRDRVNRWLLHSLGSSEEQAKVHRSMLHNPEMPAASWGRLDEAALGIELEPSQSVGAAESPHASSLCSSEFHSCHSHHSDLSLKDSGGLEGLKDEASIPGDPVP